MARGEGIFPILNFAAANEFLKRPISLDVPGPKGLRKLGWTLDLVSPKAAYLMDRLTPPAKH